MGGVEDTAKGFVKRYEFKMSLKWPLMKTLDNWWPFECFFNNFCRITFYLLMLLVIYIKWIDHNRFTGFITEKSTDPDIQSILWLCQIEPFVYKIQVITISLRFKCVVRISEIYLGNKPLLKAIKPLNKLHVKSLKS